MLKNIKILNKSGNFAFIFCSIMKINKLIIITFIFFLFGACTPKEKIPPVLPSIESLNLDFSYFEQNITEDTHYAFAVERILNWEALLKDSVKVHCTTLRETSYNNFVFQKDETWLMEFGFNIEEVNYNTSLFGIIESDTVLFKTFLSFNNSDTSLIFLDGKFYDDSRAGQWVLNKPGFDEDTVYSGIKFMTVDWSLDSLDQKEIKFTDNQTGLSNLNYILYKDSVDTEFSSYINIYGSGSDNHTVIEWDNFTKKGRIKDLLHFSDESWHCWDETYQDIDCN